MASDKTETRELGLAHVERELSRRGWKVTRPPRTRDGASLVAVSADGRQRHAMRVRTNAGRAMDNALGLNPESQTTPWWVFVTHLRDGAPVCHILTRDEVMQRVVRDPGTRSGKPEAERQFWLLRHAYTMGSTDELRHAREAWYRFGEPGTGQIVR